MGLWGGGFPGGGFPNGSADKEYAYNAGDTGDAGSIPGSGRSPGEGHDNPLQYSCLENPMDKGTWRATVQRVTESRTRLCHRPHGSVDCYVSFYVKKLYVYGPSSVRCHVYLCTVKAVDLIKCVHVDCMFKG